MTYTKVKQPPVRQDKSIKTIRLPTGTQPNLCLVGSTVHCKVKSQHCQHSVTLRNANLMS